jgi:hypothetical protein
MRHRFEPHAISAKKSITSSEYIATVIRMTLKFNRWAAAMTVEGRVAKT